MNEQRLTLNDLLPVREKADAKDMNLSGLKGATPSLLGFISSKAEEVVEASLDTNVLGLIAQAWAKASELKEAAETSRRKQQAQHVFLGEHEVASEAQVRVLVELGLTPVAAATVAPVTDALAVKIAAQFKSAGLTIDNGYIVAVEAGSANIKAELRYSNQKLLGSSPNWVPLPGSFRIDPPVLVAHSLSPADAPKA
jgi:hypothetical protein